MSAKILGQVWDLQLPAPKLLILLALADHADHNGNNIFPSIELVAWKTGYSETQARRIIKALVKDGILAATPRPGRTTMYSIHLDRGVKKITLREKGCQNDTPAILTGLPLDDTPTPAIQMTPEPSFEPSIKKMPAKKISHVSTGRKYPVSMMSWSRSHITSYYQENEDALAALACANIDNMHTVLEMSRADALALIELYQDCEARHVPVEQYPAAVLFTKRQAAKFKKEWSWRAAGWYIGEYKLITHNAKNSDDPAPDTRALNAALFREGAG